MLTSRGQENCDNDKVKRKCLSAFSDMVKEIVNTTRCKESGFKLSSIYLVPYRSHSTGLVQDCLDILAPDEILKVEHDLICWLQNIKYINIKYKRLEGQVTR